MKRILGRDLSGMLALKYLIYKPAEAVITDCTRGMRDGARGAEQEPSASLHQDCQQPAASRSLRGVNNSIKCNKPISAVRIL